ncbi:hypothetical protein ADUPG1_011896 [Aduncisulcus paluster]|uniref:Uncharacterized protein n=1 Tax=Aduncisulcus paluster TaxID=2918883 RepID=A0ABQ5JXN2_9EUKA|nr:hypothetical protein ADUPG1_011896 [Aduncisulcus paluster]
MIPPCNLREYMECMGGSLYASERIIEGEGSDLCRLSPLIGEDIANLTCKIECDLEESVEIQELIRKTKEKYFKPSIIPWPKKYSREMSERSRRWKERPLVHLGCALCRRELCCLKDYEMKTLETDPRLPV